MVMLFKELLHFLVSVHNKLEYPMIASVKENTLMKWKRSHDSESQLILKYSEVTNNPWWLDRGWL